MGASSSVESSFELDTTQGLLRGIRQCDHNGRPICDRFTKVPYALPPTGSWRWRRPRALPSTFTFSQPSGEPGDYTTFGPSCPQPNDLFNFDNAKADGFHGEIEMDCEQDEDCLYLNIWVPCQPAPPEGWPVQIHIHGGWLQVGDACRSNYHNPYHLLAHSTPRIIVAPTYRLGVFGFLAGESLAAVKEDPEPSNFGLWDQRLAIEWCAQYISLFGGNPRNMTVGGQSAGAYSAFFQLYYDTFLPDSMRLIRRTYLWSNAVAFQPAPTASASLSAQFNDLCLLLEVPATETPAQKIARLRMVPAQQLLASLANMKRNTFRASTDSSFIPPSFLSSIHDGKFGTRLRANDTKLLFGELADERKFYKLNRPPVSHEAFITGLLNFYPQPVVNALLDIYSVASIKDEATQAVWADLFGQITSDVQIHASQRGLTHVLMRQSESPSSNNLVRIRFDWRADCLDNWIRADLGACHVLDAPIWWASGFGAGFNEDDRGKVLPFIQRFGSWLYGLEPSFYHHEKENNIHVIDRDGIFRENQIDQYWEDGLQVWEAIWKAQM